MDIPSYLDRIAYTGELSPTIEVLTTLQETHLMTVPFENLDIHYRQKIDLAHSYQKIVRDHRGGFCYELNSLFYQLLKSIGFTVKMVSARAYDPEKGFGPEFDHLAIIASINKERFLVDVGFGEFALHPLKIEFGTEQKDPRGIFTIATYDDQYAVVKKKDQADQFIPEYIYSEKERQLTDFTEMCNYHQTHPASHFTQKRVCSLPTREGRITLKGNTLKITASAGVTEKELQSEEEVEQVLWDYFKIKLRGSRAMDGRSPVGESA